METILLEIDDEPPLMIANKGSVFKVLFRTFMTMIAATLTLIAVLYKTDIYYKIYPLVLMLFFINIIILFMNPRYGDIGQKIILHVCLLVTIILLFFRTVDNCN